MMVGAIILPCSLFIFAWVSFSAPCDPAEAGR